MTTQTQSKHTPGPWSVTHQKVTDQSWDIISEHPIAFGVSRTLRQVPSGGTCVATCGCCESESSHVAANARLIAAAPELLEACKSMLDWMEFTIPLLKRYKEVPEGMNWGGPINKARAAIAKIAGEVYKAEGEQ